MKKFIAGIVVVCFSVVLTANFAYADFVAGDLNVEVLKDRLKAGSKVDKILLKTIGVKIDQLEGVSEEQFIQAMNKVLQNYNFYAKVDADKLTLSPETKKLLEKIARDNFYRVRPSREEIVNLNSALLKAIYPEGFAGEDELKPILDPKNIPEVHLLESSNPLRSKFKLGVGGGIPYGGVGVNGEVPLNDYFGLSAGLGSFFGDSGWAFGGRLYLNEPDQRFRWRLGLFYGIVEQIEIILNGNTQTKTVTGVTGTLGFQWKFTKSVSFDLDFGFESPSESSVTFTQTDTYGSGYSTTNTTVSTGSGPAINLGFTYHFNP